MSAADAHLLGTNAHARERMRTFARHDAERVSTKRAAKRRRAGSAARAGALRARVATKEGRLRSVALARNVTAAGCATGRAVALRGPRTSSASWRPAASTPRHPPARHGCPPVAHRCPGCGDVRASPSPGCAARRPWTTRGQPATGARCPQHVFTRTRLAPKQIGMEFVFAVITPPPIRRCCAHAPSSSGPCPRNNRAAGCVAACTACNFAIETLV